MTAHTQDVLDIVADDWRPSRVASREAIRVAVLKTAAEHDGLVHIAQMRRHLPPWLAVEQTGAFMNRLVRRGYLIPTGHYRPNGDEHSRNASKPAAVRRLVKPIPPEEAAA
jgi:hypothetical protein